MRLHGFGHFHIQCFASSTYGFPFRINELEWYELDVCEFVSLLVEMLWYSIGGLVLYAWWYSGSHFSADFGCYHTAGLHACRPAVW